LDQTEHKVAIKTYPSPLPDAMLQKQVTPLLHSIPLDDDILNFDSHKKQHNRKHPVGLSGN